MCEQLAQSCNQSCIFIGLDLFSFFIGGKGEGGEEEEEEEEDQLTITDIS